MNLLLALGLGFGIGWGLKKVLGTSPIYTASKVPPVGDRVVVFDSIPILVHVPPRAVPRVVLYFHGHGDSPAGALKQVGPSLDALPRPPIVVFFKLGPTGEYGSLDVPGIVSRLLKEVGLLGMPVDALAHSGGYKALAQVLRTGGVTIGSVGLMDALYGDLPTYETFARKSSARHLAVIAGPTTADEAEALARDLKAPQFVTLAATIAPLAVRSVRVGVWTTSVFHPSVPAVYAAPLVEGFGG